MAYADNKKVSGRRPIYIIELYLDRCQLTYGNAPCTASGAADQKCINSYGTCQDRDNYEAGEVVLRFASERASSDLVFPNSDFNDDFNDDFGPPPLPTTPIFPTLTSVKTAPTILTPGKGLGVRSNVSITIADTVYTDSGLDPYLTERSFSWLTRGTFWQRFVDRYPFYENSRMDILTGYAVDGQVTTLDDFQRRTYLLKSIAGPDSSGKVSIKAVDPLKLADSQNTQWPPQGTASLTNDINDTVTSFAITDPDGQLNEWINVRGEKYVRVSDEVMLVNSYAPPTINVQRALLPSFYSAPNVAEEHDAEDTVQPCYEYNAERIDAVLYQLLTDATSIPPQFIPLEAWVAEADDQFAAYFLSRLLVEPHSVKSLIQELTELNALVWWDERSQDIQFKALKATPNNVTIPLYNDDVNLNAGSVSQGQSAKDRISQVWLYYGERSPVEPSDKAGLFRQVQVQADLDAETPEEYAVPAIRKIFSRWLPSGASGVALEISGRLLNEYRDTKTVMAIQLDPKDDDIWTGDTMDVSTGLRRDQYGEVLRGRYLVLEVNEKIGDAVRYQYKLQSVGAAITSRVGLIAPDTISTVDEPLQTEALEDLETEGDEVLEAEDGTQVPFPDYLDASDTLRDTYAFIAQNDGTMSNGDPGYVIA